MQEAVEKILHEGNFDRIAPHKSRSQTRIMVAMSGGVDSSVVAAILHHAGFQVVGATMRLYSNSPSEPAKKGSCCAGVDIFDAKRIASQFGFPHYVLNYEKVFKERVIDYFVDTYNDGKTPIPCVKCNEDIKFDALIKNARDIECDALITGHYLKKIYNNNKFEMHQGDDPKKDQSYFLFATTQDQLDYVFFPLGGVEKSVTRKIADHFNLITAKKPESQDICFVQNGSYAEVIKKFSNSQNQPGEIVDINGKILGQHEGIINFTVGQRKGIGIAGPVPLYVIKIDKDKNQVVVGPRESLFMQEITLKNINWLEGEFKRNNSRKIAVKVRSTAPKMNAKLHIENEKIYCILDEPQIGICPGQACVFYDDTRVLGGGWII